jgi:hypothetical protein
MMIRTTTVALITVAALWLAATPTRGAEIGKGTVELGLAGGFERANVEETSLTTLDLGARLTYSFTNRVAAGGTIAFTHFSWEEGFDETSLGATADLIVNFSSGSSVVPFGQLSVGLTNFSGDLFDDAELSYILPFVGAGFRTLLGDYASVNVVAGYRHRTNFLGIKDISSHDIVLSFGLSVFPGGIK